MACELLVALARLLAGRLRRVTEATLQAWRLRYAVVDRGRDLAAQVRQGVEAAAESASPYVLLISGEDLA